MGIVYQKDKRSGITYAYESEARWDKEKKQSRAKRRLIGRVDPETGEVVPTDGRMRRARERAAEPDYKALYEESLARIAALEAELAALRG